MEARAGGLVERAVVEAIDAVAAPARRAEVLRLALTWARLDVVPEDGRGVADFVEGPLYRAAEEVLGAELAASIRDQLTPLVEMVAYDEVSEVRPSTPGLRPTPLDDDDFPELTIEGAANDDDFPVLELEDDAASEPAPSRLAARPLLLTDPAPGTVPTLFVASLDPTAVQELGKAMVGVAALEPVSDALAVLEGLGEGDVVVIDCRRPSVGLGTLVALAPELPKGARVVLWRERPEQHEQLAQLGTGMPKDWICCGADAKPEDVATVCRVLLQ